MENETSNNMLFKWFIFWILLSKKTIGDSCSGVCGLRIIISTIINKILVDHESYKNYENMYRLVNKLFIRHTFLSVGFRFWDLKKYESN